MPSQQIFLTMPQQQNSNEENKNNNNTIRNSNYLSKHLFLIYNYNLF